MLEINAAWALFGKIAAVLAAILGFLKVVDELKARTATSKLSQRVDRHDELLHNDDERLKKLEQEFKSYSGELDYINSALTKLGTGLASLLNHTIDGNGIEKMKEERDDINDFFYTKHNKR